MRRKYSNLPSSTSSQTQVWQADHIQLGYAHTTFPEYATYKAGNDTEFVRLHLGLKGDYRFRYGQLDKSYDLIGGHHNIMYSKGIDLELENKSLEIVTFGIDFPPEVFISLAESGENYLKKFADDVSRRKACIMSDRWGSVNLEIQRVIDEIKSNAYQGKLQEIFLQAKSLELLVLCASSYDQASKQAYQFVKLKSDREKVIAARDFVRERFTDFPSLKEVAKEVGLNEYKLKRGFKEIFGTTLFLYQTECRLNRALNLLRDTEQTAAEISVSLGYATPQHFHRQFKQRFGYTPNQIRNTPD